MKTQNRDTWQKKIELHEKYEVKRQVESTGQKYKATDINNLRTQQIQDNVTGRTSINEDKEQKYRTETG